MPMGFRSFSSTTQLAKELISSAKEKVTDGRYCSVAICKYETAADLIAKLAECGQRLRMIDLVAPELNGYLKEYAIMVTEKGIYCEKVFKRNNRRIRFKGCSIPVYVSGECCWDDISDVAGEDCIIFSIAEGKPIADKKADKKVKIQSKSELGDVYTVLYSYLSLL